MKRRKFLTAVLGLIAAPVVAGTSKYKAGDPVMPFVEKSQQEFAAMYPPKVVIESTPGNDGEHFRAIFMKSRQSGMTKRVWERQEENLNAPEN